MIWLRDMASLLRQYRQAGKDYRAAMRALDSRIEQIRKDADRG